jgi:hypothetical protein
MSAAVRLVRRRPKKGGDDFPHIITRNGVPCSIELLKYREPGFRFSGRVAFALPIPPSDPYVFRTSEAAYRVIENSQRLQRKIRDSIIRDFILAKHPALSAFAGEAAFLTEQHKKK